MKTIELQEVYDLIQKEIDFNLESAKSGNNNSPDFNLGILDANSRLIELQRLVISKMY